MRPIDPDRAREFFKAGKFADAETKVDEAIKVLPSDATLHEFRSLILFAQAKYQDAAAVLYAVLAAGPGWNWETVRVLQALTSGESSDTPTPAK